MKELQNSFGFMDFVCQIDDRTIIDIVTDGVEKVSSLERIRSIFVEFFVQTCPLLGQRMTEQESFWPLIRHADDTLWELLSAAESFLRKIDAEKIHKSDYCNCQSIKCMILVLHKSEAYKSSGIDQTLVQILRLA